MPASCGSRLQAFRRSQAYLYLACGYSSTAAMMSFTMFHPILPFYLRHILSQNCTDDVTIAGGDVINSCGNDTLLKQEVSRQIGVISGSGAIMMFISCLLSGFVIQKLPMRLNHYIAFVMTLMCPTLAFFATDVITMCFANGFASAAQTFSFVCYASLFSEFAENDKQLTRMHGAYRIYTGLGYVAGYAAASSSYQFLGHKVTFGICIGLVAVDVVFRTGLVMSKNEITDDEHKETGDVMLETSHEQTDNHDKQIDKDTEHVQIAKPEKSQLRLLINPFIILNSVNMCLLYVGTSIFWGTAPNFVATELGAEQWQTGLMMGVGTGINLIVQIISAITINTQTRRIVMMIVGNVLAATGYFWYPFVWSVWAALPPDTIVRISKDMIALMITTMYSYICDCIGVHEKKFVYAILTSSASLGMVTGYYLSGVLVVAFGFRNLYLALGTTSILVGISCISFVLLKPSQKDAVADQTISMSVADLNRPDLGLAELTTSKVSLRKSNASLHISKSTSSLNKAKMKYLTPEIRRRTHLLPPDSPSVIRASAPHLLQV